MNQPSGDKPSATPDPVDETHEQSPGAKPSALRLWMFRIIAATIVPLLLLGLLELGLRVVGYGYPTAFLVNIKDTDAYTGNLWFGWRFFPRQISRQPWSIHLPKNKAGNTYRIFILGGSAAQGVPDPSVSFGRILQVMLAETYPEAKFEVVNAAMTAINSHVVLPIARDCAKRDPDLFIVYMGNNEVIGPFGAGSVFGNFSASRRAIRANISLRATKISQLIESIARRLPGRKAPQHWSGLAMFSDHRVPADDARLDAVYDHFRQNLQDICSAARESGADTIVCTVASNLRNCPPFASAHGPGLSETALARWKRTFSAGVELQQAGRYAEALSKYLMALEADERHAELQYRFGQCYLEVDEPGLARHAFARARDMDTLRFRTDSVLNNIVREVADEGRDRGVHLVNAELALARSNKSQAGIPGEQLFYEHVHLTFDGNYELARAVFPTVVSLLPESIRGDGGEVTPPSQDKCAQRLGLTDWQRSQMLSYMLGMIDRPPFTEQLGHADRREAMAESLRKIQFRAQPQAAIPAIRLALASNQDDIPLRMNLTRALLAAGEYSQTEDECRILLRSLPSDPGLYMYLAQTMLYRGRLAEAKKHVDRAIELSPDRGGVSAQAAELFLGVRDIDQAAEYCAMAVQAKPNDPNTLAMMGRIHLIRQEWQQAIEPLSLSIELRPNVAQVHESLALAFRYSGQLDQAATQYQVALDLDPTQVQWRTEYGFMLAADRKYAQAAEQYRKVLELAPDSLLVMSNLAFLLATSTDPNLRDLPAALELAEEAARRTYHRQANVLETLAVVYAEQGRFDLAIETADKAIALAQRAGETNHVSLLRQRIALFQQNKPLSQQPPR